MKIRMKRFRRFLKNYRLFVFAVLMALVAILLGLAGYHSIVYWLLSIVTVIEVGPMLWSVWQDFRTGTHGIDILAAIAIITAVILNQPWTAIVLVILKTGSKSIENYVTHRAKRELYELQEHAPSTAHLIRKGKITDVSAKELKVGEKIQINPGETVPVDAVITEGASNFEEGNLTGEIIPQMKQVNDLILSGTVSIDGTITAKVIASVDDSQYQQIIKSLRGASASKAPFVKLTARYSLPFTFVALAIAATAGVLSGQAVRFLEVIVVASPSPLLLAAPIAMMSGLNRVTRYGIIIKNGKALEQLSDTQTIAFNKTGTLTVGNPKIHEIIALGSYSQNEILGLAGSLEQSAHHVLSQAIVAEAMAKNIKLVKAKHIHDLKDQGLEATIKSRAVIVGSRSLMDHHSISIPTEVKKIKHTAVYVAVDDSLTGIITLEDELRPDSLPTVTLLRKRGIRHMIMLTGDNEQVANAIAKKFKIDHVHADMMPAEKLHVLEEVKRRPLVFIGHGIQDAPALTAADVGIALAARGSTAATDPADIIILPDQFSRVATSYEIARRTLGIALQSVLLGMTLSLLLMLVYSTGKFVALSGVLAQEVVVILVLFNSLRAHFGKTTAIAVTSEDQKL